MNFLVTTFVFLCVIHSESSMFVSKRRWILKTCGTTTPLQCIEPLLQLADNLAGYTDIDYLFYSRKNFKRPELQVSPHRGFEEEVALLDSFFDNGRAYCLGSINRDCWYLYTYSRDGGDTLQSPASCQITDLKSIEPDQTIEILMTDLDPDIMAIFTKEECSSSKIATEVRQLKHLYQELECSWLNFVSITEIGHWHLATGNGDRWLLVRAVRLLHEWNFENWRKCSLTSGTFSGYFRT